MRRKKGDTADALKIKKCIPISLSGVECEHEGRGESVLVTPSGMIYEEMTADDVVVIDRDCRWVEDEKAVFGFSGPGLYV